MFDHVGLRVKNLEAAVRFYKAALGALGHVAAPQDDNSAGIGPEGAPSLWLYRDGVAKPAATHLAFAAVDRKQVDRFYAAGIEAGGKDNGKPGVRADYAPSYYAAFLIDPDGNNIEAVCMRE
jgi:catechol 2,3-dioxygenase-like lactoylglutathione lyase family enzyme